MRNDTCPLKKTIIDSSKNPYRTTGNYCDNTTNTYAYCTQDCNADSDCEAWETCNTTSDGKCVGKPCTEENKECFIDNTAVPIFYARCDI